MAERGGLTHDLASRAATRHVLALLIVTLIWGTTFAVIRRTVETLAPGSLVLLRFSLAGLLGLPLLGGRIRDRGLWRAGLELGALSWLGFTSQAIGLEHTTASRSAFITSLSVVLVPLIAALLGRSVPSRIFLAAALALGGVGFLSWDGAPPNVGDALTLITAMSYAVYVLRLAHHARQHAGTALTVTQIVGVLPFALPWAIFEAGQRAGLATGSEWISLAPMSALLETWSLVPPSAWLGAIYLGIAATALTTRLQTFGQRGMSASLAAILYTLEPVWAAGFAAWWLGERLGGLGFAGAALILGASLVGVMSEPSGTDGEVA